MINDEYLTVAEFAERAGISRQTVYNKLDNDLAKYLTMIDNKKMLNIKGLELFLDKNDCQTNCKDIDKDLTDLDNDLTAFLQENLQILQQQLKAKDAQIEKLQQLLSQEQTLHVRTQERLLLLEQQSEPAAEPKKKWWQRLFNS